MAGRASTDDEHAAIRGGYGTTPVADLALALRRTPAAVYQRAAKLGLVSETAPHIDWTTATDARFRDLHAAGMTDAEIAAELVCQRLTVAKHRRAAGLPSNRNSERSRRRMAEQLRRQLGRAGAASLMSLRMESVRTLAGRYGLPADLKLRHVQMVLVLLGGPMTKRQVCEALGLTTGGPGGQKALHSDDEYGTYHAGLIARGLVLRMRKAGPGGGRGRFRGPQCLYMLTPAALDMLAKGGADAAVEQA